MEKMIFPLSIIHTQSCISVAFFQLRYLLSPFHYCCILYTVSGKEKIESGRHNKNLLLIAFKLILARGLIEVLGFTRITNKNLSENELIFNSVFAALYKILCSLCGLWLFLVYVRNRRKIKMLKSNWRNNPGRLKEMRLS